MPGRTPTKIAALALTLATACAAQAQAVYRCGDSYSQQPCAGGRTIEPPAAPSAGERAGAQAATRRDAALAGALERERLKQEAQAPTAYIPAPKAEPDTPPVRQGPDKSATRRLDMFTAVAPGSKPQGKKGKASPHKDKRKPAAKAKEPPDEAARPMRPQAAVRTTNAGQPSR